MPKKAPKSTPVDPILVKEIIDLGGDEKDLELLTDDSSESVELQPDDTKIDKGLQKDLKQMFKKLNFKQSAVEDMNTDSAESNEEENPSEPEEPEDYEEPKPKNPLKKGKLFIEPNPIWYSETSKQPLVQKIDPQIVTRLQEKAAKIFEQETANYTATEKLSNADKMFFDTVVKSGTLSDKISALTLRIQKSPLHCSDTFITLMNMAKKQNRRENLMAIAAIKDMVVGGLMPDRKLRYFYFKNIKDSKLLVWYFEDFLKKAYFELVQVLEALLQDTLGHVRLSALEYAYDLLAAKPEQEQNLLKLVVNKHGDLDKKVASRTLFLMQKLLVQHPAMKMIILKALEEYIFRPGMQMKTQYYAIVTMTQMILTSKEEQVANKLIDCYFTCFKKILSTKRAKSVKAQDVRKLSRKAQKKLQDEEKNMKDEEELENKMIAAILTGVNRTFPFAKVEDEVIEQHINTLFTIVHTRSFNVVIQSLRLIFQVCTTKSSLNDRFYRVLYETLLDYRLVNSNKQSLYLNLLYKALKADKSIARVKSFMKRAMQIAGYHYPPFICGIMYTFSELIALNPELKIEPKDQTNSEEKYDALKREPLYSNADAAILWELTTFTHHFHPTVVVYANQLSSGKKISLPQLQTFSLTYFLDKFVYRNPKKQVARGISIMQPSDDQQGLNWRRRAKYDGQEVNNQDFWRQSIKEVPAEEMFFHKYFEVSKAEDKHKKKKKKTEDGKASEEDTDEDEVWKAMVGGLEGFGEKEDDEEIYDDDDSDLPDKEQKSDEDEDEDEEEGDYDGFDEDEELEGLEEDEESEPEEEPEEEEKSKKNQRKKRKREDLPTFASFDDYAHMLD